MTTSTITTRGERATSREASIVATLREAARARPLRGEELAFLLLLGEPEEDDRPQQPPFAA